MRLTQEVLNHYLDMSPGLHHRSGLTDPEIQALFAQGADVFLIDVKYMPDHFQEDLGLGNVFRWLDPLITAERDTSRYIARGVQEATIVAKRFEDAIDDGVAKKWLKEHNMRHAIADEFFSLCKLHPSYLAGRSIVVAGTTWSGYPNQGGILVSHQWDNDLVLTVENSYPFRWPPGTCLLVAPDKQ